MNTTPHSLLERLRSPTEEAAWGRFVELYTPLLYHWARRFGLQQEDAADLVQEVFSILAVELPSFRCDSKQRFRGWLWTVTRNKWRSRQRRLAVRPQEVGDADLAAVADDNSDGLEETEYRKYLVGRALQIMQGEFEPTTWKACWLYVVEGRSSADVAAELGLSVNAVHLAKSRVLRRLRQELEGLLP